MNRYHLGLKVFFTLLLAVMVFQLCAQTPQPLPYLGEAHSPADMWMIFLGLVAYAFARNLSDFFALLVDWLRKHLGLHK